MEKKNEDRIQNICKSWKAQAESTDDLTNMIVSPLIYGEHSPSKKCVEFESHMPTTRNVSQEIQHANVDLLSRNKASGRVDKKEDQEVQDEILARKLQEKYQRREERWLEREKWKKLSKERRDIELKLERLVSTGNMPADKNGNGEENDSDDYELVTRPGGPVYSPSHNSNNNHSGGSTRNQEIETLDQRLAHIIQELEYIKHKKRQRAINRSSMPVLPSNSTSVDKPVITEQPVQPPPRTSSKTTVSSRTNPNTKASSSLHLNKNATTTGQLTIVANPLYFCTNSATSITSECINPSEKESKSTAPFIKCNPLYFGYKEQLQMPQQLHKEHHRRTQNDSESKTHLSYLYYHSGQPIQEDFTSQPPPVGLPMRSTRDSQPLQANRNGNPASSRPKTTTKSVAGPNIVDENSILHSKPAKSSRKYESPPPQHESKSQISSERDLPTVKQLMRQYPASQNELSPSNQNNKTPTSRAAPPTNCQPSVASIHPVGDNPTDKPIIPPSHGETNHYSDQLETTVLNNYQKSRPKTYNQPVGTTISMENENSEQPTIPRSPRSPDSLAGEAVTDLSTDPHRVPNYCFRDGSPLINPRYFGSPVTRLDAKISSGDADFLIDRNAFPDYHFGKLSKHGPRYNSDWMIGPTNRKHSTDSYYRNQPRQRNSLIEAVTNGITSLLESTGSDRKRNNSAKKKGFRPASYHPPGNDSNDLSSLLITGTNSNPSRVNNPATVVSGRRFSQVNNSTNIIPGEITVIGRDYVMPSDTGQSQNPVVRLRRNLNEESSTDPAQVRPWSGQLKGDLPVPMNRRRHSKELRPRSGVENFDQAPNYQWTSQFSGNAGKKSSKSHQRPRSGMDFQIWDPNTRPSNHNNNGSNSKRKSAALIEEEVEKLYMEPTFCRPSLMKKNFAHSTNCLDFSHHCGDDESQPCSGPNRNQLSTRLDTASTPFGPTFNIAAAIDPTFKPDQVHSVNPDIPSSQFNQISDPLTQNQQSRVRSRPRSHVLLNETHHSPIDVEDDCGEDLRDTVLPLPDMRRHPLHQPTQYKSGRHGHHKKSKHSNCKVQ